MTSCCMAKRGAGDGSAYLDGVADMQVADAVRRRVLRDALVPVPGGIFEMGTRISTYPEDLDSPRRKVRVSAFRIGAGTVTNAEFAEFVATTGYRTVAEREGWSFVFHLLLEDPAAWPLSPAGLPWWRRVDGACWSAPEGPGSDWRARPDHPVVLVCWHDARAYCHWAGLRLPRDAEWERAARGGHARRRFPWGNALAPRGRHMMNVWQGDFPHRNSAEDGHVGTAPARSFPPNEYGLYNMTGNVWEWVADRFGPRPAPGRLPEQDPVGPAEGGQVVQRGGSFLCHASHCDRYHVHSRTATTPDSATSNAGFRVAASGE